MTPGPKTLGKVSGRRVRIWRNRRGEIYRTEVLGREGGLGWRWLLLKPSDPLAVAAREVAG